MFKSTRLVVTLFLSLCTLSFASLADNHKIKDQTLSIEINQQSCAIYVRNDSEDNCKELPDNPCKNKSQCVCSKKDKYITWEADKRKNFEIVFHNNDSPFNANQCSLKTAGKAEIRCKIHKKGEFDYDVHVEGCQEKPYDPKIIVK